MKINKKLTRREFLISSAITPLVIQGCLKEHPKDLPNIIFISMDTLRADRLGCYGYKRNLSPNIDAFANDSVLFWDTMSQCNKTLASYCSMMTGLYPHNHITGLGFDKKKKAMKTSLPVVFPTLAEILSGLGYYTIAFTGGAYVSTFVGLDRGFREFYMSSNELNSKVTLNDLPWQLGNSMKWLKRRKKSRPFFLFIHSYECHTPYMAPKKYLDLLDPDYSGPAMTGYIEKDLDLTKGMWPTRELTEVEIERTKTLYDAEVKYSDDHLGDFFSFLKDEGIYEDTLVIFNSDHGEELYDHLRWHHGRTMYEELLRVPIIIKYPQGRIKGVNKNRLARNIDIMPTILFDILGLEGTEQPIDGIPLSQELHDEYSMSESYITFSGIHHFGFRSGDKKIIINKIKDTEDIKIMMFNLKDDPKEKKNIISEFKDDKDTVVSIAYKADLNYLQRMNEFGYNITPRVNDRTIERLKDLGYIQ